MESPDKAPDSGRVSLQAGDAAMNRRPPQLPRDKGDVALRNRRDPVRDLALLARARKRFERCVSAEAENRKAALDDLKFKAGEGQWPAAVIAERQFDRRPCLTINKLPTFVHQVVNDQRMNRPAININPVGDKGDSEVARMYRGLIRAIERQSQADVAYDTAFDSAVSTGLGYWRIMIEYESADTFDKVIAVKRIRNPFTVYLDPAAQEPDGSDARFGFVTEMLGRKEFEEDYPDADPMPWREGGVGEIMKNWIGTNEVRIAEYFEIVNEKRRLVRLENGHVGWWDELSDAAKELEIIDEREADFPQTKWYKLSAVDVLDEQDWPGRWVPIVKVVGNEIDIEGKVKLSGLIRAAKSPQMMYNFHRTLSVELASLQPKAPFVVAEGQIEGYESIWKQANVKAYPYIPYKPTTIEGRAVPPPQRAGFAGVPAAVMAEVQAAAVDMQAVTGIRFDATQQERMYDESGRALRELRERGDLGAFHYIDNLARSLRHCGAILVDLIPKVYDTKRVLTILREDDGEETVAIDPMQGQPMVKGRHPQSGRPLKIYNPTYGRYGVTVTIGPSYATKRIESAESIMDFIRALGPAGPQLVPLIADLVAKNQDWEGSDQIAKRLASALPPQVLQQDIEDVPPPIAALLRSLQGQVQALTNEKMQLTQALGDQHADRAQRQDKIDKDFEARLLDVVSGFEAKMAAVQQKTEQATMDRVMDPIRELAQGVAQLRQVLAAPQEPASISATSTEPMNA